MRETYWIDFGTARMYYQVDGSTVTSRDGVSRIGKAKFLDYLATARGLGHKTGAL